MDDKKYDVYINERKILIEGATQSSNSFDKSILTLSAGTFGLSIAFIKDVVPIIQSGTEYILITAWCSFAFSILSILFSFFVSQLAFFKQIKILVRIFFEDEKNLKNWLGILTTWLDVVSIVSFIVGIFFLLKFIAKNITP